MAGLALVFAGLLSACGGLLSAEQENPPLPSTTPTTRTAPGGTPRPPSATASATGRPLAASGTPAPACTGGQVVPIGVERAAGSVTVTVRVTVAGRGPYLFALDTGASSTVIDKALAGRIGLRQLGPAGRVTGVTGSERAVAFLVPSWSMGNVPLPANRRVLGLALKAGELDDGLGLSGLLGSDMLSRYGTISVDYANGELHLGGRC
jgi:hypothetical protein